jgi:hypothetical protein
LQSFCWHTTYNSSVASKRALPGAGAESVPALTKEDGMSSASIIFSKDNIVRAALRFRYVDFLVKSTPAISLAFIVYVTFKGVFW